MHLSRWIQVTDHCFHSDIQNDSGIASSCWKVFWHGGTAWIRGWILKEVKMLEMLMCVCKRSTQAQKNRR